MSIAQRLGRRALLRLLALGGALAAACGGRSGGVDVDSGDPASSGPSSAAGGTPPGASGDPAGEGNAPSGNAPSGNASSGNASSGNASSGNASSGYEQVTAGDSGDSDDSDDSGDSGCAVTTPDVLGPYYEAGAPSRAMIAAAGEAGERLRVRGTVYGADCTTPLAGALLDIWQADSEGNYYAAGESDYRLRGTLTTDAEGNYQLDTIVPGRYALAGGPRPAHIHFQVSGAAGTNHATLTTQLYFEGDPFLAPNDSCGTGCNSDEPDRIVKLTGTAPRRATFDIVLPERA